MSIHRQSVQDYMRACEALLKSEEELTDSETRAIEEMIDRLSERLLDDGEP